VTATVDALRLEFRVLGPLEVRGGDGLVSLGGAKARALLVDLLVHAGAVVSVDRLVDDLWGEAPPATARHALEVHVSQLRKSLGADVLVTRPPGYALELAAERIDSRRFERLLADGRDAIAGGDAGRAAAILREGLALWRGPPLADFTYEPFAQGEIVRLEELRQEALEERIDADLALGADAELIGELDSLVGVNPVRERLAAQLIRALYRSGRQADALAVYGNIRRSMLDELGIEPGPALRELQQAVLRQDERLLVERPTVVGTRPTRRLVTILFADIVESTRLSESLETETYERLLDRYFETASAILAQHGGRVEKFVGDAIMAVFGAPVAHEDDALRAARAALETRDAVDRLARDFEREFGTAIELHIGIETGDVIASPRGGRERFVTGSAVSVAARLEAASAPGEILLGEGTARLVAHAAALEPLGALELRGKREPVHAFRLLSVSPSATAVERRVDAPLVGRASELWRLRDTFEGAVDASAVRAVLVVGPPGIGKSRLVHELVDQLSPRAATAWGRCPSYGATSTSSPLRALVEQMTGGSERSDVLAAVAGMEDADRIGDVLSGAGGAEEMPWAFRRLCEAIAATRPLALVFDDVHWADAPVLELVEHVAERSRGATILLIAVAREDLLEEHPSFLGGAARIALDALASEDAELLADHLVAGTAVTADLRNRVLETAEGNPLFLEQLLAHAAETGTIDPGSGPPKLQSLLAARLDRLGPAERSLIEHAAVVGREFGGATLRALLEPALAATAHRHLEGLLRRRFVTRVQSATPFEESFRFRHTLIHEAVSRATPKTHRAELHERYAAVLAHDGDDEAVGFHLERAYRLRMELAPADDHSRRLAEHAGRRLGAAGIANWKRGDARAAASLLERSTGLLPVDDDRRRELLCELAVALQTTGDTRRADRELAEAEDAAVRSHDRRIALRARLEREGCHLLDDPEGAGARLLALAAEALPAFELLGDERALGRAWMLSGWVHGGVHCQNALWQSCAERALAHYRSAGWPPATCIGHIASALYFGPTPVGAAVERCEELLAREVEDQAREANVLAHLGGLTAMRGDAREAVQLVDRATAIYEELGHVLALAITCAPILAEVRMLDGDLHGAERALRASVDELERLGDLNHLSTQAAELAECLYAQEHYTEAREWTQTAERHAASDDIGAQFSWRSVRAKLLAHEGRLPEAVALARDAVEISAVTDALNQRAKVLLDQAEVLAAAGRTDEAHDVSGEATSLLAAKGNAAALARAGALTLS
jgi:class 3 adenylate cyclase